MRPSRITFCPVKYKLFPCPSWMPNLPGSCSALPFELLTYSFFSNSYCVLSFFYISGSLSRDNVWFVLSPGRQKFFTHHPVSFTPSSNPACFAYFRIGILSPGILLLVLAKHNNHEISTDDCEALQDHKVHTDSFKNSSFYIKFIVTILVI